MAIASLLPKRKAHALAFGRSLPGDFPPWQTVYTYFRNWRKDGTWLKIHDSRKSLGTQKNINVNKRPSQAIIDFHCVKSGAMVSQSVGFDAGKKLKGRKRFLTVDTLGFNTARLREIRGKIKPILFAFNLREQKPIR